MSKHNGGVAVLSLDVAFQGLSFFEQAGIGSTTFVLSTVLGFVMLALAADRRVRAFLAPQAAEAGTFGHAWTNRQSPQRLHAEPR